MQVSSYRGKESARAVPIAIVLALYCACKTREDAPAGGAAASAAASSSASSASSSASADAANSATDAATARTLDDACGAYAAAWCDAMQGCSPFMLTALSGDVGRCRLRKRVECAYELAPRASGATPGSIDACAKSISATSCDRLLGGDLPACRPAIGTLPIGASCLSSAQCVSTFCARDAKTTCGRCGTPPAVGAPCASGLCSAGLRCVSGACVLPLPLGAPCKQQGTCAGMATCFSGTCVTGARVGDPCDPASIAAPDCDAVVGARCDPKTKTCVQTTLAREGESCDPTTPCQARARCEKGKCVAPTPDWAPCTDATSCDAPSLCVAGACKPPGLEYCGAK